MLSEGKLDLDGNPAIQISAGDDVISSRSGEISNSRQDTDCRERKEHLHLVKMHSRQDTGRIYSREAIQPANGLLQARLSGLENGQRDISILIESA